MNFFDLTAIICKTCPDNIASAYLRPTCKHCREECNPERASDTLQTIRDKIESELIPDGRTFFTEILPLDDDDTRPARIGPSTCHSCWKAQSGHYVMVYPDSQRPHLRVLYNDYGFDDHTTDSRFLEVPYIVIMFPPSRNPTRPTETPERPPVPSLASPPRSPPRTTPRSPLYSPPSPTSPESPSTHEVARTFQLPINETEPKDHVDSIDEVESEEEPPVPPAKKRRDNSSRAVSVSPTTEDEEEDMQAAPVDEQGEPEPEIDSTVQNGKDAEDPALEIVKPRKSRNSKKRKAPRPAEKRAVRLPVYSNRHVPEAFKKKAAGYGVDMVTTGAVFVPTKSRRRKVDYKKKSLFSSDVDLRLNPRSRRGKSTKD